MSEQLISDTAQEKVHLVHSVLHAIQILELFTVRKQEYLSLSEISRDLNMHKTTVYRNLRTLQSVNWIQQSAHNGQYRLGSGILPVSAAVAARSSAREIIREEMVRLAEEFNEMVVLAVPYDDMKGVCIDLVKSHYNLSMATVVGYSIPHNAGATGKTLLAALNDQALQRTVENLPPEEGETLCRQIAQIRTQGYWQTENEVDIGGAAVAVPLYLGEEIYVMSISGPIERLRRIGYDVLKDALIEAASRIRIKSDALAAHKK